MADPLSISASIAGLASLADVTFKYVYKYVRAAKDAKTEVGALADEVRDLASLLRVLEALAFDLEGEGEKFDPALRTHYLSNCNRTLAQIEKRVKKAADGFAKSKLQGLSKQLKWPFSASETKELLAELSRHKATINVALATDSMRQLQLSLSKTSELEKQVASIGETVRKIEINTTITTNDQKRRILDFFMKTSPQPNLETSIKLRHAMTGFWLTESPQFTNWLETPGSKLWLTGIPGAGKTVLAGLVVQDALTRSYAISNTGAAFFFCDYKDPSTWDAVNILGALFSQLARQKEEAYDILLDYYNDLNPSGGLPKTPDPDELRAGISRISEFFQQTIIVVDGLDECGDFTEDVVSILSELAEYSDNISMALFSRDHFDIRVGLEPGFEIIHIAAHTRDIQNYVSAELETRIQSRRLSLTDMNMKSEIMDTLVSRAEGMFRWVVCQLDYLCDCVHDEERRDALKKLPPDLPESYRRLLERVNRCSPKVQEMVKTCLHLIAFAGQDLTILKLQQAVSTPDVMGASLDEKNTIKEQEISRRCSSLIRKSEDGSRFEFAHFSVQEFLENESALSLGLEKYLISATSHSYLAAQCLRFLQLKNFDQQPTNSREQVKLARRRNKDYPFYSFAAISWISLTKKGLDGVALDLAKSLFHPAKKAHFSNWAMQILSSIMSNPYLYDIYTDGGEELDSLARQKILDGGFRPLHMAAALNIPELCEFLLDNGSDVNVRSIIGRPIDLAFGTALSMPEFSNPSEKLPLKEAFLNYTLFFGPDKTRRNLTIDCLIKHGAKPSNYPFHGAFSAFALSCVLGAHLCDLTPVLKLLTHKVVPRPAEIEIFKECLELPPFCYGGDDAEASTRAILQYLNSISAYTSDWGWQVGSIVWHWALERYLSYTQDARLIDFRISMSKDALVAKIVTAISNDEFETVKECLTDGRIGKAERYSDQGDTLLHLAARRCASKCFEMLLTAGCDPYLINNDGDLPIHVCGRFQRPPFLHKLNQLGVSLTDANANGYNIWHFWANDLGYDDTFIDTIYQMDPTTSDALLQMKTLEGDTPLSLLLKSTLQKVQKDQTAIHLLDVCSKIPDFWQKHDPIFGLAASLGSEGAIRLLLEVGAKCEDIVPESYTPLHQLSATISLESVKLLLQHFEKSREYRFGGLLPVETYILTALKQGETPNPEIIEAIFPSSLGFDKDDNSTTMWDFVCSLRSQTLTREYGSWKCSSASWKKMTSGMIEVMLRLGAMQAYEKQNKESGLLPLLADCFNAEGWPGDSTLYIPVNELRQILLQTEFWDTAKESYDVVKFLKYSVEDCNLDMVRLLLEHSVDVHQRTKGVSAIEYACRGSRALSICATDTGMAIFQELLDHSSVDKLNEMQRHEEGVLHKLATDKDADSILWLLEALVKRGVDINNVEEDSKVNPPLVHHILESSIQCAELLIKLGADPFIAGDADESIDAIEAAIDMGDTVMQRTLFNHAINNFSSSTSYYKLWDYSITRGTQTVFVTHANLLHRASIDPGVDCLEFFLAKDLIPIDTSISMEGFTPLHVGAFEGSMEAVKLLLSKGFDIMAESALGLTPIHMAVRGGSLPVVKLLVENGASDALDALGKTSRRYAGELGHTEILEYLEDIWKDEVSQPQIVEGNGPSKQQLKLLAKSLEEAVSNSDQIECEMLFIAGCPIDIILGDTGMFTGLLLSLILENVEIAEWLLVNGASSLKATTVDDEILMSAIELAAQSSDLNAILPKLMERYLAEGGDLIGGDEFPCHFAILGDNFDGLMILLEFIDQHSSDIAAKYQIHPSEVVGTILNRRFRTSFSLDHDTHENTSSLTKLPGPTALCIASRQHNVVVASLLVESGASLNAADNHGWTPLMNASGPEMAKLLINLGAEQASIRRFGPVQSIISRFEVEEFRDVYPFLFTTQPKELSNHTLSMRYPTQCNELNVNAKDIAALIDMGYDLTSEDEGGRSFMHAIICEDYSSDLVLGGDYGLLETTPFPWHLEWRNFASMSFLTSRFRQFEQKLPHDAFQKILNLEPSRGWSPLCYAAALDLIDVILNCIEMGAQVDFEGSHLGSAIMFASACGSLDAVKLLVRNGASLAYQGKNGFMSCIALAGTDAVRSWLLSGRLSERLSIAAPGEPRVEAELKPWSGIKRTGVRLYGKREKIHAFSTLSNAKRLGMARKYWEDKVVPVDEQITKTLAEKEGWSH